MAYKMGVVNITQTANKVIVINLKKNVDVLIKEIAIISLKTIMTNIFTSNYLDNYKVSLMNALEIIEI